MMNVNRENSEKLSLRKTIVLARGQSGVSLISVLISMGILTVVFMAGLQMTQKSVVGQSQVEYQSHAALVRYNALQAVSHDPTSDRIRSDTDTGDNNNIRCTWDPSITNCDNAYTVGETASTADDHRLQLIMGAKPGNGLADGSDYLYRTELGLRGVAHRQTFNTTWNSAGAANIDCNPNSVSALVRAYCVITIDMRWRPFDCTGTPCVPNQVQLNFDMGVNPNYTLAADEERMGAFNVNRYSFSIVRPVRSSGQYFQVAEMNTTVGQNASNIAAGTTSRFLNTTRYDIGDNILNDPLAATSSLLTVRAGTYYCEASAPACGVNSHSIELINVSDANATLLSGIPAVAHVSDQGNHCTRAYVKGKFVLNTQSNIRIRHRVETASTAANSGGGADVAGTNVHTIISCTKEI